MQRHGDYHMEGNFFYREMEMKRKGSDSRKNYMYLEIYNLLAGYGEKPVRIAISAFVTILVFAFIYWFSGCLQYPVKDLPFFQQAKDAIYFSFVTFTTRGLGDIHPVNDIGKFLVCCEAVIGLFLVVLFAGVFQKKMMR